MSQLSVTLFRLITSLTLCYAPLEHFTKDLKICWKGKWNSSTKKKKVFWQSLFYPDKGLLLYHFQSSCTVNLVDIQNGFNSVSLYLGDILDRTTLLSCWSCPPLQMVVAALWEKCGFFSLPTKHVYYCLNSLIKKYEFNHLSLASVEDWEITGVIQTLLILF